MDNQHIEQAEEKLIVLMEGLSIQNMDEFLRRAKIGDYRNLGKRYYRAAIEPPVKTKKPLLDTLRGQQTANQLKNMISIIIKIAIIVWAFSLNPFFGIVSLLLFL